MLKIVHKFHILIQPLWASSPDLPPTPHHSASEMTKCRVGR